MDVWQIQTDAGRTFPLAADARLGHAEYFEDHIWAFSLGGGDPPAMGLTTTYGLRARAMRLFPMFTEGNITRSDPASFASPPTIQRFYPNLLQLSYAPFVGINLIHQVWILSSRALAVRLQIINHGVSPRSLLLSLIAQLSPSGEGERMHPLTFDGVPLLAGRTANFSPVVFVTGGAHPRGSPFPAMDLAIDLLPGEERRFTWTHAALPELSTSFEMARAISQRKWDAEIARLEMTNASQVDIRTGDPTWDTAFALGQNLARELLHGPTAHLPQISFVAARNPELGYSLRGDGSDYPPIWSGQTPVQTWHLAGLLLPGDVQSVSGLLENFLSTQTAGGAVDWRPGLGGQRSRLLATPLLSNLAWEIYCQTRDMEFLARLYPKLLAFTQAWFSAEYDRDGDGIPEWSHSLQLEFEEHPLFSPWHTWFQDMDISKTESPALCALLYTECQRLLQMAQVLDETAPRASLTALAENLKSAVHASWDTKTGFHYWDRDTHRTNAGETLGERKGSGVLDIQRRFAHPVRPKIRLLTGQDTRREAHIFIHGTISRGHHRVEKINASELKWYPGIGCVTSDFSYLEIEQVQVEGLEPEDQVVVQTVDHTPRDISLLLPLWAGIATSEQVQRLVELLNDPQVYGLPYGIPLCPSEFGEEADIVCQAVSPMWNAFIAEGLLKYGLQAEAANVISRVMKAICQNLKKEFAFRAAYLASTGEGLGERNMLSGLPPLRTFLHTLGVRFLSPWEVEIRGQNPFPWPVEVRYRGLSVLRNQAKTTVTFPNGEVVQLTDPSDCLVRGRSTASK